MANIAPYIHEIETAVYGEEVRSSFINALTLINDDNESYQSLKEEVLAAKDDIDSDVQEFSDMIEEADTKKAALDGSISNAGTAKTNLDTSIRNAQTAKTNLDGSISSATTKKTQLDSSISDATAKKTALDGSISDATAKKTALDGSISDAGTAKTNLDGSISTGNTLKGNLNTANQTASKNITDLGAENDEAAQHIADLEALDFDPVEVVTEIEDIKGALGYDDEDIVGVCVDLKNKTFERLAGARGLTAGTAFDKFIMFGGRKRCNVADDGTISAYYGDSGYKEDGSNGQVMVYQPKFWYKVVPLTLDKQADGVGYHIRKANYYVSSKHTTGFKIHPAFIDVNGKEVDYILLPAYEGCLYDVSESAYNTNDTQNGDFTASTGDKLSSIAGVKPASGSTQQLTRPNVEITAQNRGANWHGYRIQDASLNQLLMLIELAGNVQSAVGQGVVNYASGSGNEASNTGSTSSLGNKSGQATQTTHVASDGTTTVDTVAGKLAISYRGMENPWGNIWDFVYGINIHGNGNQKGGIPYICTDFNFAESKNTGNYESAGFTVTNANGYISAFGYGNEDFDWLFIASECTGDSALPIGDYTYITANLNGYRIALLGGSWGDGASAGGFYWRLNYGVGGRYRGIGGRLVYVPIAA